jgi:hypothetical protein
VGLEALVRYASVVRPRKLDIDVDIFDPEQENGEKPIAKFSLNEDNKQAVQQWDIPYGVPKTLKWLINGEGCCLVQVRTYHICLLPKLPFLLIFSLKCTWQYSVQPANNLRKNKDVNFDVTVVKLFPGSWKEIFIRFEVSFGSNNESLNKWTLDVELLSGFKPRKSSLDQLYVNKNIGIYI